MESGQHPSPFGASQAEQGSSEASSGVSAMAAEYAASAQEHAASLQQDFGERPEIYVGAAFAGGLLLAGLVRLFGR
jgi:hypothetical protein